MDKTGIPVTSTIWLVSPNAASMKGMSHIGLVAGIPALSTANGAKAVLNKTNATANTGSGVSELPSEP